MTLPASGSSISMAQVNAELGRAAGSMVSLNDAAVRALAGASSGAISLANLLGKSSLNPGSVTSTMMPTGTYSSRGSVYTRGGLVQLVVAANGSWKVFDAVRAATLASGSWTTAPAAGVGALFNYTLTLTSYTGTGSCDGSSSGTLASDFTLNAGEKSSSAKPPMSITPNYSLTITEIKNTANTRTVTFTLHAYAD